MTIDVSWLLLDQQGQEEHPCQEGKTKKHETIGHVEHEQKAKNTNIEMSELEERDQEIADAIEKSRHQKKEMKYMTHKNNAKDQVERENAGSSRNRKHTC